MCLCVRGMPPRQAQNFAAARARAPRHPPNAMAPAMGGGCRRWALHTAAEIRLALICARRSPQQRERGRESSGSGPAHRRIDNDGGRAHPHSGEMRPKPPSGAEAATIAPAARRPTRRTAARRASGGRMGGDAAGRGRPSAWAAGRAVGRTAERRSGRAGAGIGEGRGWLAHRIATTVIGTCTSPITSSTSFETSGQLLKSCWRTD